MLECSKPRALTGVDRPKKPKTLYFAPLDELQMLQLSVRIQVFDWGIREGINKSQEWADIASRKKVIALLP
jgi:hypothetical protein